MKTSELTGAHLDYWVARAEGVPAEQLTLRPVPRTDWLICVRQREPSRAFPVQLPKVLNYSTDWAQGGPLMAARMVEVLIAPYGRWLAQTALHSAPGDTPLQAICRAVVRAAFGDEVEEVAVCE
jgi:hypothetical protein